MSETSIRPAPMPTGAQSQGESLAKEGSDVEGSDVMSMGTAQLRDQIDQRTTQIGQQVRSFASTLRRTGSELESQSGGQTTARAAGGVADRLERVGGYLEDARGDDLLRDAERVARERPLLVAGAAAAVGFTLSRLLKASSESRYEGNGGRSYEGSIRSEQPTRIEPQTVGQF